MGWDLPQSQPQPTGENLPKESVPVGKEQGWDEHSWSGRRKAMVKHLAAPFAVVPGPARGPAATDMSKPARPSKTTDTVQCFPVFPALYSVMLR